MIELAQPINPTVIKYCWIFLALRKRTADVAWAMSIANNLFPEYMREDMTNELFATGESGVVRQTQGLPHYIMGYTLIPREKIPDLFSAMSTATPEIAADMYWARVSREGVYEDGVSPNWYGGNEDNITLYKLMSEFNLKFIQSEE